MCNMKKPGIGAGTAPIFKEDAMKTALVTGGSRGIGAETVRQFRARGWQTFFTYLHSEEAARALEKETGARAFRCDARREAEVDALAQWALKPFGHIDALVCNAGTAYTGLLQDMPVAAWDDLFALHVRGAFLATRAFLPGMLSRGAGSIVYVSSMWGQTGASCEAAYSACKAALIGLGKAMAKEAGPAGVRVNCVAPGVIRTDMLAEYDGAALETLKEEAPLCRLGTPLDVARAVCFLCGEEAGFITGQTLGVNGGFVI